MSLHEAERLTGSGMPFGACKPAFCVAGDEGLSDALAGRMRAQASSPQSVLQAIGMRNLFHMETGHLLLRHLFGDRDRHREAAERQAPPQPSSARSDVGLHSLMRIRQ